VKRAVIAFLAAASLVPAPAASADAPPAEAPPARPKVVLVLSGGGARGSAHIGVLKVLEEYHVPVDMIVGTSMGSIVGGLYAAGWSVDEIEGKISTIDWGSVFVDRLPRQTRTYRRKTDDARFLVPVKMRFKKFKPYLPPALLGGQSMELLFKQLEIEATGERNFDHFPIPYRAVATDLSNGQAVVLNEGSLSTAMRASMSLPGIFPPVEIDGKPLSDGGMAANFPIRIAKSLGAGVVIGVDISSPLRTKEQLGNILTRIDQTTGLLTNANKADDMEVVRPQDVIMVPALGDLSFSDFARADEAIAAGEASAREQESRLRALSVPDDVWAAFVARHHRRLPTDLVVDEVRITNTSPLSDEIIKSRLAVPLSAPLDESKLAPKILRLYSLDAFAPIQHDFVREDGKGILTIDTPPKPYGRNSLQFGFQLVDDFRGDSGFNLTFSHLMNPVNRLGGEWRNVFQIGENSYFGTEFYQPFDPAMAWYVRPKYEFRRDKLRQYDDLGNATSEYRVSGQRGEVTIGRVFGNWGSLAAGGFRSTEDGRPKVGPATLPQVTANDGGVTATFRVDTLDTVTWPRDGVGADVTYQRSLTSFGAGASGNTVRMSVGTARTIGKNILFGSVEAGWTFPDLTSIGNEYFLGGFLRLSGLAQNQLVGDRGGLARLLYYGELGSFNLGSLTQRMYAGFSAEGGNVYSTGDPVTWQSLRYSASVFFGADTVIGPAYLGYGYAQGGRSSVYLVIGQRF